MPLASRSCRWLKRADVGVAEEQAAEDVAVARLHRHREIAAHRQVPLGHALVRRVVAIPRLGGDVVAADDAGALEGRLEHRRVARHRELRERLARDAGDGVKGVSLAFVVDDVVEESAERGGRQFCRRIGHRLDDGRPIERTGDDGADGVQRLGDAGRLLQQLHALELDAPQQRDVAGDLRGADDPPVDVADRRHGQRDRHQRSVLAAADGLEVVEAIAAANAGQRLVFLGLAILRDQPADRRTDHLGGTVAEHPLRRLVPRLDDAVEILADDRVVGGLDDGGEAA